MPDRDLTSADEAIATGSIPETLRAVLAPVTLVTGHYGVGKTNFALNLALDLAAAGWQVRLCDLDVVNPYFRSSEYRAPLEDAGVALVTPVLANTAVDVPSLSAGVDGSIEWANQELGRIAIIDVGGDDVGATALGRYTARIKMGCYAMLYVVNAYRSQTRHAQEAVGILREIQAKAGFEVAGVVNNSHLKADTDAAVIEGGTAFGQEVGQLLGVPVVAQTVPINRINGSKGGTLPAIDGKSRYAVRTIVATPWE